MQNNRVKKVVIAGGGTAGWVTAAALSKKLGDLVEIVLVESENIGTIGVGEATIPPMRIFHSLLGINEQEFMRATSATFKLGISFENWGQRGDKYIHPFGTSGKSSFLADFQHFWLHSLKRGMTTKYDEYCFELQAAKANKFATSKDATINYAYHLDATRYAQYLRRFSESFGLKRIEGKINQVHQHANGNIKSLTLDNGQSIEGDLFIDCTGFQALLIDKTLSVGYEDWSHWLPCDSAFAVQTESTGPLKPYTRAVAHENGWQWQIPLQHRTGNGLVFSSQHTEKENARDTLVSNVEGKLLADPRLLTFKTGRRKEFWNKNCIAIGLSSGFIEPLESTSIFLFMNSVMRLLKMFPFNGIAQVHIDEYNQQAAEELISVRDFIILHYHVTERVGDSLWDYVKNMSIPDSLLHRIELFKENGCAFQADDELFRLESWTHVMLGQGIMPRTCHEIVSTMSDRELTSFLNGYRNQVKSGVASLPDHQQFINHYCKVPE